MLTAASLNQSRYQARPKAPALAGFSPRAGPLSSIARRKRREEAAAALSSRDSRSTPGQVSFLSFLARIAARGDLKDLGITVEAAKAPPQGKEQRT